MQARFLFGPAGSGKTFRCLTEVREELVRSPDGPDLILLAPKQATFQLERQLLADGSVRGYTRLQILSFERLAAYLFDKLGQPLPELLSEEGRVMVLRAILETLNSQLRVYRASARMSGFSRQLSVLLRELQRRCLGPMALDELAAKEDLPRGLADKVADLALILRAYLDWAGRADEGRLKDAAQLLNVAVETLNRATQPLGIGGLWLDGFAEMTPQEQSLLSAVLPHCNHATLAFCLPQAPRNDESWLSPWTVVSETAGDCLSRIQNLPSVETKVEVLERDPARSRFGESPKLAQLERAMGGAGQRASDMLPGDQSSVSPLECTERSLDIGAPEPLRLVECSDVEAEARLAAREILSFVRAGNRFRDCAVLVRTLEGYQDVLRRVLTRYGVPFFLDRREPVSHHPLAELTRFALRTAAFDWRLDDWLGALKTGLTCLHDAEADVLENAALARRWEGSSLWLHALPTDDGLPNRDWLESRRGRVVEPFVKLHQQLRAAEWKPTGKGLATLCKTLWQEVRVEARLEEWGQTTKAGSVHATVWEQMNDWIDNLERAFRDIALPVREWLQIIEAGLSGLSVGVIPPALDQVLVGSVDRSRNPDLKLALVLGANEGVFPAPPARVALLSEAELEDLETHGVRVGSGRRQFGHERYLGYIALSRARQRVVVSWSVTDEKGNTRNPSRLVEEVKRNFPEIGMEEFNDSVSWEDSQHPIELAGALLGVDVASDLQPLRELPQVRPVLEQWRVTTDALRETQLSQATADALYGGELKLSVSALETFAACPFHFFAAYGLGARERDEFEVDFRQMGSFQHEVLSEFHKRVLESGKRWRELKPAEAVQWVREIGGARMQSYEHGLFLADASREFQARALLNNLERVVATLTQWARNNEFEPAAVEVSFGLSGEGWPGWRLDLGNGRSVILRGRVDRVDLLQVNDHSAAVAILDYKSGGKVFDDLKFESGLQLQMPAYLNAICANAEARKTLGASTLNRAGIFYVGLRLRPESGKSREEAIASGDDAAASAFQHRGRFDASFVQQFDNSGSSKGGQFRFSFNKNGSLSKRGNDLLTAPEFAALLDHATDQVRELAGRILSGEARVSPYRKGQEIACGLCPFLAVCRFDSWTQDYRLLKRRSADQEGVEAAT